MVQAAQGACVFSRHVKSLLPSPRGPPNFSLAHLYRSVSQRTVEYEPIGTYFAPHDTSAPSPFDAVSAAAKVRAAEDAWNSRDPVKVAAAYTLDTAWRNRSEFLNGRSEVEGFLTRKWQAEREYRLIKELWTFGGARIAVRFTYEARSPEGQWLRAYGNENWEFAPDGLMAVRRASINDLPITESERLFHWPLGRRPDDHPSLSDLGL